MKVITQAVPVFRFVPRFYPSEFLELELIFENGFEIDFTWLIKRNTIEITLESTELMTQRGNYSFTVIQDGGIVYKGKLVFLKDNTDVQNYTNQSQDNARWQE